MLHKFVLGHSWYLLYCSLSFTLLSATQLFLQFHYFFPLLCLSFSTDEELWLFKSIILLLFCSLVALSGVGLRHPDPQRSPVLRQFNRLQQRLPFYCRHLPRMFFPFYHRPSSYPRPLNACFPCLPGLPVAQIHDFDPIIHCFGC